LKPDKYEHGVPTLDKEVIPIRILLDEPNKAAIDAILNRLGREKKPDAGSMTNPMPEAISVGVEPPLVTLEDDDVMAQLEKIINIANSDDDEEDDKDKIIQQTLF
jgi:hypothetical protein